MPEEKSIAIKAAFIGFFGAIIAALITIYPQIRSSTVNTSQKSDPPKSDTSLVAAKKTDPIRNTALRDNTPTPRDSPTAEVKQPPQIHVDIPPGNNPTYDFDDDLCGTLFTVIGDARNGFRNLKTKLDTVQTKPWLQVRIRTKIRTLIFETQIGEFSRGNSLYMLYRERNPGEAEALFNKYLDKIKKCLKSDGEFTVNKEGSKFYKFHVNDDCVVEVEYIKDPNQCYVNFRSLVKGDNP